jgi:hypothetical protein
MTKRSKYDMPAVQRFAIGGIANPSQQAVLRGSDRSYLDARQKELDAFEAERVAYNDALTKYQTEVYDPYKAQSTAYNAAAQKYNDEVKGALLTQLVKAHVGGGVDRVQGLRRRLLLRRGRRGLPRVPRGALLEPGRGELHGVQSRQLPAQHGRVGGVGVRGLRRGHIQRADDGHFCLHCMRRGRLQQPVCRSFLRGLHRVSLRLFWRHAGRQCVHSVRPGHIR